MRPKNRGVLLGFETARRRRLHLVCAVSPRHWGKGKGNIEGVLREVHRQKVKVVFGIEYEKGGYATRPEIARSLAFLDRVAAEIAE
jgi:hypothetical protein